MSWKATQWAKETRGHRTPGQKLVLMILADYAEPRSNAAWPHESHIAEDAELSVRSVQRHLAALVADGFITTTQRGNQHQRTEYHLGIAPANLAQAQERAPAIPVVEHPPSLSSGYRNEPSLEPSVPSSLRSEGPLAVYEVEVEQAEPVLDIHVELKIPPWMVELQLTKGWSRVTKAETDKLIVWGMFMEPPLGSSEREQHLMVTALAFSAKVGTTKRLTYVNLAQAFKSWASRPLLNAQRNGGSAGSSSKHAAGARASDKRFARETADG